MSDIAIKVENLSKLYQLGEVGTGTLSKDLNRLWAKMRGKEDPYAKIGQANDRTRKAESDFVWALKDINFEVKQGEVLGIIGKNGAGKSTLLKILSKITSPTTGKICTKGRIASLLEVGTGFHPEMTGRENIYLNGAILGMRKWEIDKKFDEIVDFAGVEAYIDTPVKRYSSGMYVRLAFAVAAFLEPEILIVDEVLAVGDADFQKKCIGRMKDVSVNDGRTVLFVSHNMAAVNKLCTTAVSMWNGKVDKIGQTDKIIAGYLNRDGVSDARVDLNDIQVKRSGNKKVFFTNVSVKKSSLGEPIRIFSIGESLYINFSMNFLNPNQKFVKTSIVLKTADGMNIANMIDVDSGFQVVSNEKGISSFEVVLKDLRLYPNIYYLSFWAGDMSSSEFYDFVEDCISFEIIDGGMLTSRHLPSSVGLLFLTPSWEKLSYF
jgi:lipopolysaccharide transport system ATP-binding protein